MNYSDKEKLYKSYLSIKNGHKWLPAHESVEVSNVLRF